MNRRNDHRTAELVSLALLTSAAYGEAAGMHSALHAGVPTALVAAIFHRAVAGVRFQFYGIASPLERRKRTRD